MTQDEIRHEVNQIVTEIFELDDDELKGEADFHAALGGDSIQKLELILALEKRFGLHYSLSEQAGMNCVNDVVRVTAKYAKP
jgi:acyl carrier protein